MTSFTNALRALPLALVAITLTACGNEASETDNDADSFAARIGKSETPAPAGTVPPTIAPPLPGAAPGPFAKGTLTDPATATCGAPLMGPFIGKLADQPTRAEIVKVLGRSDNLRFVAYNSDGVNPDATNPRLSIMLDAQNIIRDARCG